jgi:hypothetical protein
MSGHITVLRTLLFSAAAPPILLALLAVFGARAYVGVVTTGAGSGHDLALGALWVATWLASVIVSPIAALASVFLAMARLVTSRWPREDRP